VSIKKGDAMSDVFRRAGDAAHGYRIREPRSSVSLLSTGKMPARRRRKTMVWSSFRIPPPKRRRHRAIVPRVLRLERRALLAGSARHAPVTPAQQIAADVSQAAASVSTGVEGYDPTNLNNPSVPPAAN
jgi:hypothetical protein